MVVQVEWRAGFLWVLVLASPGLLAATQDDSLPQGFLEFLGNMVEVQNPRTAAACEGPDQNRRAAAELVDPLSLDPGEDRASGGDSMEIWNENDVPEIGHE